MKPAQDIRHGSTDDDSNNKKPAAAVVADKKRNRGSDRSTCCETNNGGGEEDANNSHEDAGLSLLFAASLLQQQPPITNTMPMPIATTTSTASMSATTAAAADTTFVSSGHSFQPSDVLCGRGGFINKHSGNVVYRRVVDYNKAMYQQVPKRHRILVSQSIVRAILNQGGRFLSQQHGCGTWKQVDFSKAVLKTSQALREKDSSSFENNTEDGDAEEGDGDEEVDGTVKKDNVEQHHCNIVGVPGSAPLDPDETKGENLAKANDADQKLPARCEEV
jgi:hypothetical protein